MGRSTNYFSVLPMPGLAGPLACSAVATHGANYTAGAAAEPIPFVITKIGYFFIGKRTRVYTCIYTVYTRFWLKYFHMSNHVNHCIFAPQCSDSDPYIRNQRVPAGFEGDRRDPDASIAKQFAYDLTSLEQGCPTSG